MILPVSSQLPFTTTSTVFESTLGLELLHTVTNAISLCWKRTGTLVYGLGVSTPGKVSELQLWRGDNGKLLSNTPRLGPESSVMVVVGTVPLALFCLTLPGWNHCLISRKKGHWGPNILSSTTPKVELPWRLGRKSNPTCRPHLPQTLIQ